MLYKFNRHELKTKNASQFKDGDMIVCGKYCIHIRYGQFAKPGLCSYVTLENTGRAIGCTPGAQGCQPYYINDFIHR